MTLSRVVSEIFNVKKCRDLSKKSSYFFKVTKYSNANVLVTCNKVTFVPIFSTFTSLLSEICRLLQVIWLQKSCLQQ